MALSRETAHQIAKLNDSNYETWKFKMEMYLMSVDLYEMIINPKPEITDANWIKKDTQCRALINLHIADSQILHVKYLNTAKETWDKLQNVHQRANLTSKLFLLRKLYSIKLHENGDMHKHINDMLEITDKLRGIGEVIPESHIAALLLCSLPESYSTLITALEARSEIELTPDFIKGKLIDEYNRRMESNNITPHTSHTVAFKGINRSKSFRDKKYCTHCHKTNHTRQECWHLRSKNVPKHYKSERNVGYDNKQKGSVAKQEILPQSNKQVHSENENDNLVFKAGKNCDVNWFLDSGATAHMCNNLNFFTNINMESSDIVTIADGTKLNSKGIGEGYITVKIKNGEIKRIKLEKVLYVPELESNLSIRKIVEKGFEIKFKDNMCTIYKGPSIIANGIIRESLYEIITAETEFNGNVEKAHVVTCQNKNCILQWHRKLGHRSMDAIKQIERENLAYGLRINKSCKHDTQCIQCIKGKLTEKPFAKETAYRSKKALDLVHSDICGPIQSKTISGKKYFITFVDDFSRFTIIFLLNTKNEAFEKLREYVAMTRNKFGRKMKVLRTDNGGEYTSREIEQYLRNEGIYHETTVPYSPAQNGVAERKNRTLMEMTKCMLFDADLPQKFWGEAILTAAYLQNRLPTRVKDKTPYELWTGKKPSLKHIARFGCKALVFIPKQHRRKLDQKAIEGIFVGYENRSKAYRVYISDNDVRICRTVKFIEEKFIEDVPDHITEFGIIPHIQNDDTNEKESNVEEKERSERELNLQNDEILEVPIPRRSNRTTKGKPPERLTYKVKVEKTVEPKNWREVQNMPEKEKQKWVEAMEEEIQSLKENQTWELCDLPDNIKPIGCKWLYKIKHNAEGKVERYKARLVAQGCSQKYGQDYDETFAPVVTYTTIRAFLASAAHKNMYVRHLDVKTAFLHGELKEELYMKQPEGFVKPGEEMKICKLNKTIYGLKQSAQAWNAKISDIFLKCNFLQSKADPCLFTKKEGSNITYVIIYVDDLLVASTDHNNIQYVINKLRSQFKISDLGDISYYLGIEIVRTKEGFLLSQTRKIEEAVEQFNLTNEKPTNTPMDPAYFKEMGEYDLLNDNTKFRQAVGVLLYISTVTRPDISASVNILSRRNEKPRERDWIAVKRVIRYLNTTKNIKLKICNDGKTTLTAYSDADWGNDHNDRKSTSGMIFKVGNSPIFWNSKKQNCVALSSTEAEYISAASAAQEIIWLIQLIQDLDFKQELPITLYQDNKSCIQLVESNQHTSRTKHVDIKFHYIKDLYSKNIIKLSYIPSKELIADIFTKALPRPAFEYLRKQLSLT